MTVDMNTNRFNINQPGHPNRQRVAFLLPIPLIGLLILALAVFLSCDSSTDEDATVADTTSIITDPREQKRLEIYVVDQILPDSSAATPLIRKLPLSTYDKAKKHLGVLSADHFAMHRAIGLASAVYDIDAFITVLSAQFLTPRDAYNFLISRRPVEPDSGDIAEFSYTEETALTFQRKEFITTLSTLEASDESMQKMRTLARLIDEKASKLTRYPEKN